MNELQAVTAVVSVLQVGFAGWVAVYLLTKIVPALNDLAKSMAVILTLIGELRVDQKESFTALMGRRAEDPK